MSKNKTSLFLHEEVLLLALRDKEGTVAFGVMCELAMGGAIAAELLLRQKIEIDTGNRPLVNVVDEQPLGNEVLDECLTLVTTASRRARLRAWVPRFARRRRLKHRVAQGLCAHGILREDEDRVLLLFRRRIYPEIDPQPERKIVERLRRALLSPGTRVEPRTLVLLSLVKSADLLRSCFEKREIKENKRRIADMVSGELAGQATGKAIQAVRVAATMAAITPAIAATAATSG